MRRQNEQPQLPGRLANMLRPKTEDHKRRIAESVKRYWQQRRREEAAAAQSATADAGAGR